MPNISTYNDALFRRMDILNTHLFGKTLTNKILGKRENVEIRCGLEVCGYKQDQKTKCITSVEVRQVEGDAWGINQGKGEGDKKQEIACDVVVLCNGPHAGYHIF